MTDERDAGAEPLLDEAMLGGLRAALGPATDALVKKAAEVVEDRMAKLVSLAAEPSEELARLAHEVGGVSAQVGLKRLSVEALALERLCRAGQMEQARAAAGALGDTARVSVDALEKARD